MPPRCSPTPGHGSPTFSTRSVAANFHRGLTIRSCAATARTRACAGRTMSVTTNRERDGRVSGSPTGADGLPLPFEDEVRVTADPTDPVEARIDERDRAARE